MINITHETSQKGKKYAKINAIQAVPKSMPKPEQVNESFVLSYDEWSNEKFEQLPDFIKDAMKESDEYKALVGEPQEKEEDDVPF